MVRTAIVGCGRRAVSHLDALRAAGGFDVVALCDIDRERAAALRERHEASAVETDPAVLQARHGVELAIVTTPPHGRADVVETLVDGRVPHILIEKPIAPTPAEVARIVAASRRAFVAVNTQYRWMPHWQRLLRVIGDGLLGPVHTLVASSRTNVQEQGAHVLDLAFEAARRAGLGEPDWVVAAAVGREDFSGVDVPHDLSATVGFEAARLHWNQGPSAPEVAGEDAFFYHLQLQVIGVDGRLHVTLNRGFALHTAAGNERGETRWPRDDAAAQRALFEELRERMECGSLEMFPTRIEAAARCSDLVFAAYASAVERRRVQLPWGGDDSVLNGLAALRRIV